MRVAHRRRQLLIDILDVALEPGVRPHIEILKAQVRDDLPALEMQVVRGLRLYAGRDDPAPREPGLRAVNLLRMGTFAERHIQRAAFRHRESSLIEMESSTPGRAGIGMGCGRAGRDPNRLLKAASFLDRRGAAVKPTSSSLP